MFATDHTVIKEAAERVRTSRAISTAAVSQQVWSASSRSAVPVPQAQTTRSGSMWDLVCWVSPRAIEATVVPPVDCRYPYMAA